MRRPIGWGWGVGPFPTPNPGQVLAESVIKLTIRQQPNGAPKV